MSRKLTITLIFFLFLLPFVSWYYLQSGLTWRKNAQEVLHGTEQFPGLAFQAPSGDPMEKSQLENHVTLVALISCDSLEAQIQLITRLYTQFKETHKTNFLLVDTCLTRALLLPDSLNQGVYSMVCDDSVHFCTPLLQSWPAGKEYALVDKRGIIRAYYKARTHDEKRILVEHMALLLPRDHSEKVQLKREVEKKE